MNNKKIINNLANLRKIREDRGITQTKLAIDLEVTQELISRYEIGSSFPQPQMLIQLAKYFNCSVDYLLGLTDDTRSFETITNSNEISKQNEIINKYSSLSKEKQEFVNQFLTFLLNNDTSNFKE